MWPYLPTGKAGNDFYYREPVCPATNQGLEKRKGKDRYWDKQLPVSVTILFSRITTELISLSAYLRSREITLILVLSFMEVQTQAGKSK